MDIIHTNGAPIRLGGAGLMEVSGHVDFYVNGGERQPGCPSLVTGTFEQLFSRNLSGKKNVLFLSILFQLNVGVMFITNLQWYNI